MKGSALVIDGKLYNRDSFGNLPHGLNLESASTIKTPDGTAFQSHCSPLSNFYPCNLVDKNGTKATSVEHLYAIRMAEVCPCEPGTRRALMRESNPYTIRSITKRIKKTDDWNKKSEQILREIVELKFVRNPSLMAKLQSYPGSNF